MAIMKYIRVTSGFACFPAPYPSATVRMYRGFFVSIEVSLFPFVCIEVSLFYCSLCNQRHKYIRSRCLMGGTRT